MHSTEFRESCPAAFAAERIYVCRRFRPRRGSAATRASGRFCAQTAAKLEKRMGEICTSMKRRLAATKRSEQGATERSRVPSPIASRLEDTTGYGKRKFELLLQALLPEVFS